MYYAGLGKKKADSSIADKAKQEAKKAKEDLLQLEHHLKQQQYAKIPNWILYTGIGLGALLVIALFRKR